MPLPMLETHPSPVPSPSWLLTPASWSQPHHGPQEPSTAPDTPSGPGPQGTGDVKVPGPPGPAPGGPCAGDSNMFLFLGLGLALMYFLVMRPENKRRKEQQAMLAAVKVGDRVVTLGGMHGVVAGLDEKTLTLRVDTVKMTFDRTAIARVVRDEPAAAGGKTS
jgi:preprotein translocase subunit YajC